MTVVPTTYVLLKEVLRHVAHVDHEISVGYTNTIRPIARKNDTT